MKLWLWLPWPSVQIAVMLAGPATVLAENAGAKPLPGPVKWLVVQDRVTKPWPALKEQLTTCPSTTTPLDGLQLTDEAVVLIV